MIQPLQVGSSLASNPNLKELPADYFVEIEHLNQKVKLPDPKAIRALIALMDMRAVIGGAASHYGGPAGFSEILSVVYSIIFNQANLNQNKWYDLVNLVNDAGHCENAHYAVKALYQFADLNISDLWSFRSMGSPLTGHGEAHLFPQGVLVSNGPLGSSLPVSQGLAMADALSGNFLRTTVTLLSDGAAMEGEAKEAFAAIAGFAQKGALAPFVMIISDNNTKLSGRIDEESFSLAPSFKALGQLGWDLVTLESGNDLLSCYQIIQSVFEKVQKNPKKPVAIWAKTTKGIGHLKSVQSASGGHGFSLKSAKELSAMITEIYQPQAVPSAFFDWINQTIEVEAEKNNQTELGQSADLKATSGPLALLNTKKDKVQIGVSAAMISSAEKGLPLVSITSDLPGSTGVAGFRKAFPQLSLDVGIAESNMVSVASGFSKVGYIPVVDTFAQFGVTKGALPLIMANLSQAPVMGVFSHIGFQDAADGASHQGLNYLAMSLGLPHTQVWSLSSAKQAQSIMEQAFEEFAQLKKLGQTPPSYLFFLGRENFPLAYDEGARYFLRKHEIVYDSSSNYKNCACIIAMGTLIPEALKAANKIEQELGAGAIVIHPSYLTQPDWAQLKPYIQKCGGRVVFVEDHQKLGGFSEHWLAQAVTQDVGIKKSQILGVEGEFGQSAYQALELYEKHGLSAENIFNHVKKMIEESK